MSKYPAATDATPEELVRAMARRGPPDRQRQDGKDDWLRDFSREMIDEAHENVRRRLAEDGDSEASTKGT